MSNPFRDQIQEPRWMTYGPDDEPDDEGLSGEAIRALEELGDEWLDPVDIRALMETVKKEAPNAIVVEEAYEEWLKATKAFRDSVLDLLEGEDQ